MDRVSRMLVGMTAAAVLLAAAHVRAAGYNEFVDGDLSNVASTPTFWPLETGPNVLVANSGSVDFDVVQIDVPERHVLESITIEFHGEHLRVFGGIQTGGQWTAGLGASVDELQTLGWMDFPLDPEASHEGEDILFGMSLSNAGFFPPLASGDYTLLFQTSGTAISYALAFNVRPRGDFDFDLDVDDDDLTMWVDSLGVEGSTEGDADGDGDNDGHDFLIWQYNYGLAPSPPSTATPEPGGAALAAVGLAALAARRRSAARCDAGEGV